MRAIGVPEKASYMAKIENPAKEQAYQSTMHIKGSLEETDGVDSQPESVEPDTIFIPCHDRY